MKVGETFDRFYFKEFADLMVELEDMGRELDNESLMYLDLNALPPSWSTFVDGLYRRVLIWSPGQTYHGSIL